MSYFGIVFLAVIVEGIITYIKEFFVNGKFQWQMLISIAAGILVSAAYGADVLTLAGLTTPVPYLGNILTGILISRGSNYVFDLVKSVQTEKNDQTAGR